MFCEYFHSLKALTLPASQRQGDTGPSTPVLCAVGKSDATQRGSEAKKLRPKTEALYERRGQLMKRVSIRSVAISCFLLAAPSFAAADNALFSSDDGNVVLFGDIGLANIKAQEFVYRGAEKCSDSGWESKGHKCSQLNWESKGMTLFTAGVDAQIDNDWSLKGSVKVGAIGDGHMTDYDWASPGHDDWSHRSIHPDTELDHYIAGSIEIDRIIYGNETSSIAVGAGVRYTDVKWTAYGGSDVYSSDDSFRDQSGTWPSGKGISYRQKIPVGFVSLSGEHVVGDLTISGGIQGGLSFGIKDIDDHWLRDLRFRSDMSPAPTIGANVAVSYAVTPAASLYLSGSFERVFQMRGNMLMDDTAKGTRSPWLQDEAGANFESMSISFGLKGTF
ncbi:omptin family outer membrane protease [Rhizobium mongolense]|uniref:omptin family outer membrane protease n=1 Tax=Rhizobium mongolense TaxID=57676 RepID=UPI0035590ABB